MVKENLTYSNKELKDSEPQARLIDSANIFFRLICLIFLQFLASGVKGMVSVTTNSSIRLLFIFSIALPDKTACVAYARTVAAPASFKASTALQIVPAVSIISSTIMQFLFFTSPIICITWLSFALGRRLSIIDKSAPGRCLAKALALTTPPTSGETTIMLEKSL